MITHGENDLKEFLKNRKITGHPKDKRVEAFFCVGCNMILPREKFLSNNTAPGSHLKVRLCEDCRMQGLTPQKIRINRKIQTCTVCLKEKQTIDFLGNKFNGDPYENKSKVCWQCRERFELIRQAFMSPTHPICPFCKVQKNSFAFPVELEEAVLKKAQEFTGALKLNKACTACRRSKDMEHFALYHKRICIKTSKKNSMAKE